MSDGVGSKLSMRIPARSSLRRGSTALTALDGGAGSLFARADWDEVAEEIGEVFSLSESIDLINGRRLITELDERLDLDRVLQDVHSKDQLQRLYSGDILLSLLVGGQLPPEAPRSERLGNAGRIARQVVDSGAYHCILQNLGRAVAAIHRPDTLVSAPPSFWTDSKEIRLHFNIVLVVLITLREVHLANSQIAGKTLVEFGLDLVASDQCDLYPLKKVLQLIRLSLLITFGDISSAQFDRPGYLTQSKARRRDVFKVCKHISECFGPVLCIPNPVHESGIELVTFSNTPRALAHRATYLRSCVHLGYSDMEDYVDLASDGHAERPETSSEALYRTLQTNLRQSVVALLKILLSVAPSVRPSAQMVNSDNEFIIAPGLTSLGETLERARHTEIITKSIAFILLALLKCFRRGHPLQFCSLLCLLQDKNALVLILKFLNQNVSGSLMKRNDVDAMRYTVLEPVRPGSSNLLPLAHSLRRCGRCRIWIPFWSLSRTQRVGSCHVRLCYHHAERNSSAARPLLEEVLGVFEFAARIAENLEERAQANSRPCQVPCSGNGVPAASFRCGACAHCLRRRF